MNWISLKEQVPEVGKRVLVWAVVREGEETAMFGYRGDDEWIIEDDQNWEGDCVTHWMPIPQGPETKTSAPVNP